MMSENESSNKYVLLRDAIRRKNKEVAQNLLLDNAPVNPFKKPNYNTPLHWTIKNFNDTTLLTMLLNKGADIYAKNHHQQTPFQIAVECNSENALQLLMNKSTNIGDDIQMLIIEATTKENENIIKWVVTYATKKQMILNLRSAVDIAAKKGFINILKYLLRYYQPHLLSRQYIPIEVLRNGPRSQKILDLLTQHGFTISSKNKKNFKYVYAAVEAKCLKTVKDMLKNGINVNEIHEKTGYTLLHLACINKDAEMVKVLIKYQANLNIKVAEKKLNIYRDSKESKFQNKTSLFIATRNCDVKVVKLLLMNGAIIKKEPNILKTAAKLSSNNDCITLIEILLEYGAKVNATDNFGATPLYYSIVKDSDEYEDFTSVYNQHFSLNDDTAKIKIVILLLKNGANPNINHVKVSPLQAAIAEGYLNIVKLLLEHNADINHINLHGNTPLHFAANADTAILDVIFEHNPNMNAINYNLMSPFHVACMKTNYKAMKKLFEGSSDSINKADINGDTPLHLLCRACKNVHMVNFLLKHNASVNAKNKKGQTPLHIVALYNWRTVRVYNDITETLMKHNADIDAVDYRGETPLTAACKAEHEDIAQILLKHGADINWLTSDGNTLLCDTAKNINNNGKYIYWKVAKMFVFLLNCGADINITSNNGRIALNCIKNAIYQIDLTSDPLANVPGSWESVKEVAKYRIKMFTKIREHVIKLQCAKLALSELNFALIYENNELRETADSVVSAYGFKEIKNISAIENRCKEEIQNLKLNKFSYFSLYDFLTKDIHDIAKFAKNKSVAEILGCDRYKDVFPLYSEIIKNRFAEAVRRSELLEAAEKYSRTTVFRKLPLSCIDHIFSYFDRNSLAVFINTIK